MPVKLFYISISFWLLWSSVEDIVKGHITKVSVAMGGLLCILSFFVHTDISHLERVSGLLMGIFFFCVHWITKNGVGFGDVVLISFFGIMLGLTHITGVVVVSLFLTAIFSIGVLTIKKVKKTYEFPYIPFVFCAWMGSLFL